MASAREGGVRMRQRGFTLVELMIVVAIIGVLAVVAVSGYRKYSDKARASEVYAMFGEIRAKQEAYRAEFSSYCNTSTSCATMANEDTVFPALLAANEPKAKPITGAPVGWTALGISPGKSELYCGYVAVAGFPNAASFGTAGTRGKNLYNNLTPTRVWWYMSALCDNDGNIGTGSTTYTSGMNTAAVVVTLEGR